jgi:predicted nicotinamide N-methyase
MKHHTPPRVARLRQRILWRIQRRYQVTTEQLRLADLELSFTRIADPDRVLDQVAQEEDRREKTSRQRRDGDDLHLPYWAELWDSAMGLAQFLACAQHEQLTRHSPRASVLDLGCGMGLPGTVAAALGARVLFADLEPPALLFARLNSLTWARRVRTRRINWRSDRLDETFDLILGADILYERAQWEHLERFWRGHLAKGASVLLAEPGRQTGDLFIEWIRGRRWVLQPFEQPLPTRSRPIRLFRLVLPPA